VSLPGFLSIPAPPHLLITVTYLVAVGCTVAAVAVVVLDKENQGQGSIKIQAVTHGSQTQDHCHWSVMFDKL
jgi:hypothetical protein